jgi:hypothetical protein
MIPIKKSTRLMLMVELKRELKTLVALIVFCLFMNAESPQICRKSAKNIPNIRRKTAFFKFYFHYGRFYFRMAPVDNLLNLPDTIQMVSGYIFIYPLLCSWLGPFSWRWGCRFICR